MSSFDAAKKQSHFHLKNKTETPGDEALVAAFKAGEHDAFQVLISRHSSYILDRCYSYVKDRETAKDLSQEILIKLFLKLPRFREQARFKTWLYSIIHNACIDHLRSTKSLGHEVITEKLADAAQELIESADDIPNEKTMALLEELLTQMTPEGRLILLMKYAEKQSLKDIQDSLGLSESAVKMRLKRAREALNKIYKQSLHEPSM